MYVYVYPCMPCIRIIVEASSSACVSYNYHAALASACRVTNIIQCTLSFSVGAFLQHESLTWISMQRQHQHFFPHLKFLMSWYMVLVANFLNCVCSILSTTARCACVERTISGCGLEVDEDNNNAHNAGMASTKFPDSHWL